MKENKKPDAMSLLLLCLIFFASLSLIGATINLVNVLTKPDGTYQKCVIPAEGSGKGFYCDPVEKEEYWPHRTDDLVDNPDGTKTWWVSHAR